MERKITIEEPVIYKEDYQMRMLQMNTIEGLLPVRGRGMDGHSFYDYDVSGKISMKAMYERGNMSEKDIKIFLKQFKRILREIEKYLLDIHCLMLDPEYIFYGDDRFYFMYYPVSGEDLWESFHRLTESMVKWADYEDKDCVRIIFCLHKETMEENYDLEKIIEKCIQDESEKENRMECEEEVLPGITYDTSDHDWIAEQELGSHIMEETDNLWMPVKRFLRKHKKPKWGEWDGLYIEEEEL